MGELLVRLNQVGKEYIRGNDHITGITNVSFDIFSGEIVSILGPSGCGKSTILRLIGDIIKPTIGNIAFQKNSIEYARNHGLIGLVPQAPILMPNRTVWENIYLPLEIKKVNNVKKIRNLINTLGLTGFENAYPQQLSGGMKQRVSLARALSYDPKILLMDEPFASLDELMKEKLHYELMNIHKSLDQTIIFVTHDIEEAVFISDRVILMTPHPGTIKEQLKISLPDKRNEKLRTEGVFFNEVKKLREAIKKC